MQNIALLGAGFIGSVHAAALASNPRVHFSAVYDTDTSRAERLAADHQTKSKTLEAILADEHVDAVLIAT